MFIALNQLNLQIRRDINDQLLLHKILHNDIGSKFNSLFTKSLQVSKLSVLHCENMLINYTDQNPTLIYYSMILFVELLKHGMHFRHSYAKMTHC